jgi:nucleotide-binding universal stress UspA family protein
LRTRCAEQRQNRGTRDAELSDMDRYRIVAALDLSECAEIVLEHALDQAARHDQPDLHFVTVVPDERAFDDAKRKLAELVLEGLDTVKNDWRARLHVRIGKPAEEIVALAEDVRADLIVVGRFGGATGRKVLDHADCPVLAINLSERQVDAEPQCPDCVQLRAESDGESWFCPKHAGDRPTTTLLSPSTTWTGGTLMW